MFLHLFRLSISLLPRQTKEHLGQPLIQLGARTKVRDAQCQASGTRGTPCFLMLLLGGVKVGNQKREPFMRPLQESWRLVLGRRSSLVWWQHSLPLKLSSTKVPEAPIGATRAKDSAYWRERSHCAML